MPKFPKTCRPKQRKEPVCPFHSSTHWTTIGQSPGGHDSRGGGPMLRSGTQSCKLPHAIAFDRITMLALLSSSCRPSTCLSFPACVLASLGQTENHPLQTQSTWHARLLLYISCLLLRQTHAISIGLKSFRRSSGWVIVSPFRCPSPRGK